MSDINQLYKVANNEDTIFSFVGVVTSDAITSILYIVKSKLDQLHLPLKVRKKIFNILVESVHNLYHHTGAQNGEENFMGATSLQASLVQLSKIGENFEITTGNIINKESEKKLKQRLAEINQLDNTSLREQFRFILENGSFSEKGTAGLGFIDIARKANNKLVFDFKPIDDKSSFFILNIKVN